MLLVLEDVKCQCWLCWLLVVFAVAKLKISNCSKSNYLYTLYNELKEGGGGRGRGRGVPIAPVLYNMHATLCYSIAQHMFSYAVPESPTSILL